MKIGPLICIIALTICTYISISNAKAAEKKPISFVYTLNLKQLMGIKVEVASKSKESLAEALSSVYVFQAAEIRDLGITRLQDLLNLVPGIQTSANNTTLGQLHLVSARGSNTSQGEGILYLYNGQRLNTAYNSSGEVFSRLFDITNLSRVEIIRGPGSALYGSGAMSAVINLVVEHQPSEVAVGASSYNGKFIASSYHHQWGDIQSSWTFDHEQDDGELFHDIFDRFGVTDQTRDPKKMTDVSWYLSSDDWNVMIQRRRREFNQYYNFGRVDNDNNNEVSRSLSVSSNLNFNWFDTVNGKAHLSYLQNDWSSLTKFNEQGDGPFIEADFLSGPVLRDKTLEGAVDFNLTLNENSQLFWGVNLQTYQIPIAFGHRNYDLTGRPRYLGEVLYNDTPGSRFVEDKRRNTLGVYTQLKYAFSPTITGLAGVRWDKYNDTVNNTSPRLALGWQVTSQQRVKLMYGEAFRAPGLSSLYAQNNPVITGNPNLIHVSMKTLELSYSYEQDNWSITTTLFDNQLDDYIALIPVAGQPQLIASNIGTNETQGFEFEFNHQISEKLLMRGSYSHYFHNRTAGVISLGDVDDQVSGKFAALMLNYQQGPMNVNFSLNYRQQAKAVVNRDHLVIAAMHGRYSVNQNLEMVVTLNNLFDQQYWEPASGTGLGTLNGRTIRDLPQRGRQWSLGLRWRF